LGTVVSQTITDGITSKSPSEDAVFDNLALKVDKVAGSRLITSAESTILGNTSGTNTGDQTLQQVTSLGSTTAQQLTSNEGFFTKTSINQTLSSATSNLGKTEGEMNVYDLSGNSTKYKLNEITKGANSLLLPSSAGTLALTSDLTTKVTSNTAITGATKTKITYDSKGLVTSGADATTADIADSSNKRYVTDANLTVIGNTSGTNTGDQIISDATISLTDITTNNFSTTKHGFVPKGTNTGKYLKDDGTWSTISAGGLTYFTEAQSTASPNATVNVDSLTAVASTTDADFSILAKGTGAILASIPNNIATVPNVGGNKRGQYALDLQHYGQININTEVASGNYSVITGGTRNTASSQHSFIGTGSRNTASGDYSVIISGQQNTASNNYASVISGQQNNASNIYACVIGGYSNGSSGQYSTSSGATCSASGNKSLAIGDSNTASGLSSVSLNSTNTASSDYSTAIGYNSNTGTTWGKWVLGGGGTTLGSSQKGLLVLTIRTTGNTPTELAFANTTGADARSQMTCQDNTGMRVKGSIIAKQSGSVNISAWDFDYVIVRSVGVGTTSVVIANVNVVTNIPAWGTPTITADTAKGFASIKVTGATTTNIQWTATLDSCEVIYA
jgi:hypothetical protein